MSLQKPLIHKHPVTWILVANGRNAQIYTIGRVKRKKQITVSGTNNEEKKLLPVPGMEMEAESAGNYEIGNDILGRVFESSSSTRHMASPHINIREEIQEHFVKNIAERLHLEKLKNTFDRLILVAPPKMLSQLKKNVNHDILNCIRAEVSKELTNFDTEELYAHLSAKL
jgi:protein required for attachment to host cells